MLARSYDAGVTHYEVLGVSRGATRREIRAAYLELARRYHPDRADPAGGAASEVAEIGMRRINEAWAVLGNESRRQEYDRILGMEEPARPLERPWRPYWRHGEEVAREDDPSDLEGGTGAQVPRWLQVLPPLAALAALALGAVALVTGIGALWAAAVGLALISGAGFVGAPLVAMFAATSRKADGSRTTGPV